MRWLIMIMDLCCLQIQQVFAFDAFNVKSFCHWDLKILQIILSSSDHIIFMFKEKT